MIKTPSPEEQYAKLVRIEQDAQRLSDEIGSIDLLCGPWSALTYSLNSLLLIRHARERLEPAK